MAKTSGSKAKKTAPKKSASAKKSSSSCGPMKSPRC